MNTFKIFLLSFLLLTSPAWSQDSEISCTNKETLDQCESKFQSAAQKAIEKQDSIKFAAEVTQDEVDDALLRRIRESVPPEVGLAMIGDLPSINFIDRLGLSFSSRALEGNEQVMVVGLPFFDQRLKAEVLVREPAIYGKILEQLPKDTKADREKELDKSLGDLDNLTLSLAWQIRGERLGRKFADNHRLLKDLLLSAQTDLEKGKRSSDPIQTPLLSQSNVGYNECISIAKQRVETSQGGDFGDKTMQELFGKNVDICIDRIKKYYLVRAAGVRPMIQEMQPVLDTFDALVSGQPQLSLSAKIAARDDLVGPEEDSVELSYELGQGLFGGRSVNGLRSYCKKENKGLDLGCYDDYLEKTKDKKDRKGTFTTSATWTRTRAYDFSLPDDGVSLDLDRKEKITYKLTYEYPLGKRVDDSDPPKYQRKIVVGGSYAQWMSDTEEKDRGLLEASFIQRISDDTSATFGLAWANHPEFLEEADVDKEVTAKFGLNFRIGPNPK